MKLLTPITILVLAAVALPAQETPTLKSIRKIYVDKMANDFDQYLRAEIIRQFKGKWSVVLKIEDADAIITGVEEQDKSTGAMITGRYLGLHDTANSSISLVDKTGTSILWADQAGDRNLFFGALHSGGQRKVADRLVEKLKKAVQASK